MVLLRNPLIPIDMLEMFIDPIMYEVGYEPKTTFWADFTIADMFGLDAVQDTFDRAFGEWKANIVYATELAMVLNHKIWQHYEHDEPLARLYDKLWREVDEWCIDFFEGDDLSYYYRTTD